MLYNYINKPLAWGVFSDVYGRRRIYIVSLFISLVAGIGSALSNNIYLLLIFRGIQVNEIYKLNT